MCIRDRPQVRLIVAYYDGEVGFGESLGAALGQLFPGLDVEIGDVSDVDVEPTEPSENPDACLLYTSDAADERSSVDLGGRRIIKKQNKHAN